MALLCMNKNYLHKILITIYHLSPYFENIWIIYEKEGRGEKSNLWPHFLKVKKREIFTAWLGGAIRDASDRSSKSWGGIVGSPGNTLSSLSGSGGLTAIPACWKTGGHIDGNN